MFRSIIDVLDERVANHADKIIYSFLDRDLSIAQQISYKQLQVGAMHVAHSLRSCAITNDRVLILLPSSARYIECLFGCFYAGQIVVPLYPPKKNKTDVRLASIIRDCTPRVILTNEQIKSYASNLDYIPKDIIWITAADMIVDATVSPVAFEYKASDLAMLQYTSGSTSLPKGVMISHGNIMANAKVMSLGFDASPLDISFSWLPLFHDMGLMFSIYESMYADYPVYFSDSIDFVRDSFLWPNVLSKYKARVTGGPNFAFEQLLSRLNKKELTDIDLSHVRKFFCGSEPIIPDVLKQLEIVLSKFGMPSGALYPCYGLAESTLLVAGNGVGNPLTTIWLDKHSAQNNILETVEKGDPNGIEIMSCGTSFGDTEILIVDPRSLAAIDDLKIGEIWVHGASVAMGYWDNPKATDKTFKAKTKGGDQSKDYLRTGDLGFMVDGQLYITGRIKELMIIRGKNHYPQDIELSIQKLDLNDLGEGGTYSFSVHVADHIEVLVVLVEVKRTSVRTVDVSLVKKKITQCLLIEFGLKAKEILLVNPMSLPRTSSGKKQRLKARNQYLENELKTIKNG